MYTGAATDDDSIFVWNFPARTYSASEARWVSPDPAGLSAVDLTNPQS
jgi:hypothetical protein